MRRALILVAVIVVMAVVSTWATSATLTTPDGRCEIIQTKHAWSFAYSERRVCP